MKGKIVKVDNTLCVEYKTVGDELDSVENNHIRLNLFDRKKVEVGDEVEFEIKSFYNISSEDVATIIKK